MKKLIFIPLLLLLGFSAFSQDASEATTTQAAAKLVFEETEFNFGEIRQGDVVEHVFKFTNDGNAPLVLSNMSTSCGCTVPEWPREPIQPGETGEVKVKFDSRGKIARQNKVITVFSNAETPQQYIKLVGNVLARK